MQAADEEEALMPRVALVTGGNRGIGLATCKGLARRGCSVIIGARDPAAGMEGAAALEADGHDAHVLQLDVTDAGSIAYAVQYVADRFGRLDILVNNAGVLFELDLNRAGGAPGDIFVKPSEIGMDQVRRTFEVNVLGVIAVTSAFLPLLRQSAAGRIIGVSSRLASLARAAEVASSPAAESGAGYLNLLAYNSSKSALNAAMLQYMIELRGTDIRVDVIDPGHCATDINGHSGDRGPDEAGDLIADLALDSNRPGGRFWQEDHEMPW